tara:strand:+ start:2221 stop:2550 length:330 start_codon:yes stop_codon:yes gene_type:complete
MIRDISNKRIIGRATRNNESGSGGENIAPRTNEENQMCFRYIVIVFGSTMPTRNASIVTTGAWNPMADAMAKLRTKPTYAPNFHCVERPASCASVLRYSRSIGVSNSHA